MSYTKEEIEQRITDFLLDHMLASYNQETGLISVTYNEQEQTCDVKLNVVIIEQDDYIGFAEY